MNIITIGFDLAKSIFQVCGVNQAGKSFVNNAGWLSANGTNKFRILNDRTWKFIHPY